MITKNLDKYIENKNERKYKKLDASILKNDTWCFQKMLEVNKSLVMFRQNKLKS